MFVSLKIKRTTLTVLLISIVLATAGITALAHALKSEFSDNNSKQVPILMYHSILKDESKWNDYILSPVELEKDIVWLKENGYQPVFVKDLISYVNENSDLPEKPVVLTFDDGSYNNLTYVIPLLEKYDFKATFSVVGSYSEFACEEAEPSPSYSYLDWDDIKKMMKTGRAEFANHTYDLHSLNDRRGCTIKNGETYEQFRHIFLSDIFKTQHLLENNCNISPDIFAYPYGMTCEASKRLVKNSGFSASLGVEEKINSITIGNENCLYELGRFNRPAFISTEDFMKKYDID